MDDMSSWEPIYREPGTPARLFVQTFAFTSPLLTAITPLVPAGIVASTDQSAGGIALAASAGVAYVLGLIGCLRGVRRLASRFTPPLTLPGDIWNIGVAEPPRRSRNWPIRFRRRRGPNGGMTAPARAA
ncbi:MAG: hypothetical protein WAT66_16795 [Actinomycetota bacterium]